MAAAKEILYAWGPGESRLAVVAAGRIVEIHLARPDLVAGAVFLGRVVEVVPALDAAFVEIGTGRPGFLPGATRAKLANGQAVLVQVKADAHPGKGAVLTAQPSLAGRWLAYSPLRPGVAASRQLIPEERQRLTAVAHSLAASGEGLVVRSAAAGRDLAELAGDLAALRRDWASVEEAQRTARCPSLLWRPDPLARLLADHPSATRVRVDDAATLAALRSRFGDLVQPAATGEDTPATLVEEALEAALEPAVPLPGGGRLIIEPAAALTAIDVDSAGARPPEVNRAAVQAVAGQLRLRAIGGQVVVDFVSEGAKGAPRLAAALKKAVADDPVPTHVLGVGPLGLVELTRERRGPSLAELTLERDRQLSSPAAALLALRRAVTEARHRPGLALALRLAPEVAAAVAGLPKAVAEAEARIGQPLTLRPEAGRGREDPLVEDL